MESYINSFSPYDLKARQCNSLDEYKKIINTNIISANLNKIHDCIEIAEKKLKACTLINYSLMDRFIWKFLFTTNLVENGFPFTCEDIIYIPIEILNNHTKYDMIKLLIHERIHIFQRYFPTEANKYILSLGYQLYKKNNIVLRRANPDIDNFIYILGNKLTGAYYTSINPKNINDVIQHCEYEHPYEHMAYVLSDLLM